MRFFRITFRFSYLNSFVDSRLNRSGANGLVFRCRPSSLPLSRAFVVVGVFKVAVFVVGVFKVDIAVVDNLRVGAFDAGKVVLAKFRNQKGRLQLIQPWQTLHELKMKTKLLKGFKQKIKFICLGWGAVVCSTRVISTARKFFFL